MPKPMHDWTLLSEKVDWKEGVVSLEFENGAGRQRLHASGLRELHVPRTQSWGPSVSVLESQGPSVLEDGSARLSIQMQTGDRIEIVAHAFDLPAGLVR